MDQPLGYYRQKEALVYQQAYSEPSWTPAPKAIRPVLGALRAELPMSLLRHRAAMATNNWRLPAAWKQLRRRGERRIWFLGNTKRPVLAVGMFVAPAEQL
jgi:hypothetical protein